MTWNGSLLESRQYLHFRLCSHMMKLNFDLHSKTFWFSSSNLMEKLNFRWKYQSEIFELSLKQYRKGKYNKLEFSQTLYLECLILNSNYKWAPIFISRKAKWVLRYVTTLLQFTALEVESNTFFFLFEKLRKVWLK